MSREGRRRWGFNETFVIGRQDNPMMRRWRLLQTPLFGIYVHFIYREDLDPAPHDHPWRFASLVLRGGYLEEVHEHPDDREEGPTVPPVVPRHWLSFRTFPLWHAHRITWVAPGTTTLVFVGRKRRTWGFWDGGLWVDYRDALALRPAEGVWSDGRLELPAALVENPVDVIAGIWGDAVPGESSEPWPGWQGLKVLGDHRSSDRGKGRRP